MPTPSSSSCDPLTEEIAATCKTVGRLTRDRIQAGAVPVFLGIHGLLALLYDKIRRYNDGYGPKELTEMASDALVIACLVANVPRTTRQEPTHPIQQERAGPSKEMDPAEYEALVKSLQEENS